MDHVLFTPAALRVAKAPVNFGHSGCNKVNEKTFEVNER